MSYLFRAETDSVDTDSVDTGNGENVKSIVSHSETLLTVGELNSKIGSLLKSNLPSKINVKGEVSGLNVRNHYYFVLKNETGNSQISAIIWASNLSRMEHFENGDEIEVEATINIYQARGTYSLIIHSLHKIQDTEGEQKRKIEMVEN